jgi:hypothetical protein
MYFFLVLAMSLILSLVIIDTIVKCTREGYKESFERCLCSPLGQPECSVYSGPSQYDRMYSYNNYGGPSEVVYGVNNSNVFNPLAGVPYNPSQADRGYYENNTYVGSVNVTADVNVQSSPLLIGSVSQADKGYANVYNSGYVQSGIAPLSYGIDESTKLSGLTC